jgi:DNA-binding transcriptional regulator of glucitol operon
VRRILLSPTWWGRHLLAVVLVVVLSLLGRWQWSRAMASTGSLQNLLYAIEWWVFAGLVILGWALMARDEVRGVDRRSARVESADLPAFAAAPAQESGAASVADAAAADDELATYNAYLAWLAAHPRR